MFDKIFVRVIAFCTRRAWWIIAAAALLTVASCVYIARDFAISTDVNALISADQPWRKRELAYQAVFPQGTQLILAVIEAPNAESTGAAADALTAELARDKDLFNSVDDLGGGPFFARNGLLFLPMADLKNTLDELEGAGPSLAAVARDPSLRGIIQA